MCTAATYKTDGFYFGRTLDYEFSYGDEIVVTPRRFPLAFSGGKALSEHFALLGMAHVADGYPLYYDAVNEKGLGMAWVPEALVSDQLERGTILRIWEDRPDLSVRVAIKLYRNRAVHRPAIERFWQAVR